MSSPASTFSNVPALIQNSIELTHTLGIRLQAALKLAQLNKNSEHHTARCAIMILLLFCSMEEWNIVPQFFTNTGKWPDLALEHFIHRPGKKREIVFVSNIFVEFKRGNSPDDPIAQMKKAIISQHGPAFNRKGILIGVRGVQWRFVDYHFVVVPDQRAPQLLTVDFAAGPSNTDPRPIYTRTYQEGEYMDFATKDGAKDIISTLLYISKGKRARDLSFKMKHTSPLEQSISLSTLGNNDIVEDEKEEYLLSSEFDHLAPLIRGEVWGEDIDMEE